MANPRVPQGTLNRALTSVSVIDNPDLNITSGYFGSKVARISFEGETSDYLPTLTGNVPSGKLFQTATITMYLNKSQALAAAWENQRKTDSNIGDIAVVTDATSLETYYFENCILQNIPDLELSGESNDFPVTLKGTYPINDSLFFDG